LAHFVRYKHNKTIIPKDLERFLYHLRIKAQVYVLEIDSTEIEPYVYQRTMKMEERVKMLNQMKMRKGEKVADIQVSSSFYLIVFINFKIKIKNNN
jgi:hypothetical protein